ncbi:TrmH family RNA methyltransferase [uncultured Mobiluncus sp.]|uniref:TrmH family RNA methyltransferase n=1 Tax=uncultured Mobiluncus sp. TaxID=293425 RepID=UPI0027D9B701|nr:TrmH family RNA methyltransferase [uncultured Mobiluncus sp.]
MVERREILDNPGSERIRKVAGLSRRSARLRSGLTRVEGPQAVTELLHSAPQGAVTDLFVTEAGAETRPELLDFAQSTVSAVGLHIHIISPQVEKVLSDAAQGWIAVARFEAFPSVPASPEGTLALILPATQDPGNAGTLIRLADACGASTVFMGQDCADATSPKVIRASVGSVFHVPTPRFQDLEAVVAALRAEGWTIVGTSLSGDVMLTPVTAATWSDKKVAWVMGNEAHGLDATEESWCDVLVSIPMFGRAESLNVTSAATLCLWLSAAAQRL